MDNQPITYSNPPVVNKTVDKKNNSPKVVVITVIVLAIVFGTILYLQNRKTNKPKETVTQKQELVPTATPTPSIDKQDVKIQVLNGTGTPGQAASAVSALENAGYNKDNITTDNAADNNHAVTTIEAKTGYSKIAADIKSALASTFDTITIELSPLDSDSEYDIVVTTGGKKYEESTPTPALTSGPTATPTGTLTPSPTSTPTPTP